MFLCTLCTSYPKRTKVHEVHEIMLKQNNGENHVPQKGKNMENKQYSRYGTGKDCPLLMMANYEYPECRGANCAWWSGNCCSVQSISMNTGDIESVADALYER